MDNSLATLQMLKNAEFEPLSRSDGIKYYIESPT